MHWLGKPHGSREVSVVPLCYWAVASGLEVKWFLLLKKRCCETLYVTVCVCWDQPAA